MRRREYIPVPSRGINRLDAGIPAGDAPETIAHQIPEYIGVYRYI
jgi:hypothetical protein